MSRDASQPQTGEIGGIFYTLALIAVLTALAGLGLAYGVSAWFERLAQEQTDESLTATHIVTIGAQHYIVPAALLTDPAQRRDGFADRMDMTLALPIGPGNSLSEIELTIMPRGRVRSSAHLLDNVYMRQFSAAQVQGAPGLVGKPLEGDAGIGGETVWYDPLSATPFVAKCMAPVADRPSARTCLRTVLLSDRNAAIFSFAPDVLENWRQFDATIETWLDSLRK